MNKKDAVKTTGNNIKKRINHFISIVEYSSLFENKNITCFDSLMFYKVGLLRTIIKKLPIYSNHCPYCVIYKNSETGLSSCENCEFGKLNMTCGKMQSLYSELQKSITCLVNLIEQMRNPLYTSIDADVEKDVVKKVINSLKNDWWSFYKRGILSYVDNLNETNDINIFMKRKASLLRYMIDRLPFGKPHCPYCCFIKKEYLKNNIKSTCDLCSFGKKNGICAEEDSLFHNIKKTQKKVISYFESMGKEIEQENKDTCKMCKWWDVNAFLEYSHITGVCNNKNSLFYHNMIMKQNESCSKFESKR